MSKVDRNNPKRSLASESTYSLIEFVREFLTLIARSASA